MAFTIKPVQQYHWRNLSAVLAVFVAALGAAVLCGWASNSALLKSGIPGLASMKANTALGFFFSAATLLLILFPDRNIPFSKPVIAVLSLTVFFLGAGTLVEYFFGADLKIDQLFFSDTDAIETSHPGRMSPSSAFCFSIIAIALLLSVRTKFELRFPLVSAVGITTAIIGTLNSLSQILNQLLNWQWWNYSGVALHTAAGFLLLGLALTAMARSQTDITWSLGNLMTAGFSLCILSLLMIGVTSFHFTKRLQQTSILVYHTHDVLKEIENVRAGMADLESSQRGYIIFGQESLLTGRDTATRTVYTSLKAIRNLTVDNPAQQGRLNELERFIPDRIAFGEQTIQLRKQGGFFPAQAVLASGKGIRLTEGIKNLLKDIRDEEYRLGVIRENDAKAAVTSTFLFLPLGVFLSLVIVLIGAFLLNAGMAQQKQAEQQVQFQASLLDQINDAVIAVDTESRITGWNHAAEALYGWTPAEVLGHHSSKIIRSQLTPEARQAIWQQILDRGSCRNEFVQFHRDGTELQIEGNTLAMRDEQGRFTGILSVNRDITERRLAEGANNRLAAIVNASDDAIIGKDLNGIVTSWNKGAQKLFGYSADEMIGAPIFKLIPTDRHEEEIRILGEIRNGSSIEHLETVRQTKDGRLIDISMTSSPIRDINGRVTGASKIARDITERRKAEEKIRQLNVELEQRVVERTRELQSQTSRLQRLIASSPDAIITLDLNRQLVTSWNNSAEKLYGYSAAEAIGKTTDQLVKTERVNTTAEQVSRSFAETGEWRGEVIQHTKTGEKLHLLCSAAFIRDGEGKPTGVISINRDISELKDHERQQAELNAILAKNMDQLTVMNNELEAFSYSVSHDLRAPLRGIDGWSQALLEDYGAGLDVQARQYLERVRAETKRMDLLIDAMLDLSHITRAEMRSEKVSVSALAETISTRLNESEPARHVEWKIQPDLFAQGDSSLIEIVLSNLLGNAHKFTRKTPDARIEFGRSDSEPDAPFFVRDNGAGFDMNYAKKLFGAFQRMHKVSDFAGTGVGLATVQRIIHRHGGRIWAESAVNKGATFYFTLGEIV